MKSSKDTWFGILGIILLLIIGCGALYSTFLQGTTSGPDFVSAVKQQKLQLGDVRSVEVIIPRLGQGAFTRAEYDALVRSFIITDASKIAEFLKVIGQSESTGWVSQNHPVTTYRTYCKVNLANSEYFYLYVKLLNDYSGEVCYVESNTRNATNPNGAKNYRLTDFVPFLNLLKGNVEKDEPNKTVERDSADKPFHTTKTE